MTTTVTAGTSGRNYTDPFTAINALTYPLSDDYIIACYNDGEMSATGAYDLSAHNYNGHTVTIQPAAGQGFADNAGKLTNALRYDQSNGCAMRWTTQSFGSAVMLKLASAITIIGMQFYEDSGSGGTRNTISMQGASLIGNILRLDGGIGFGDHILFDTNNGKLINNVIYVTAKPGSYAGAVETATSTTGQVIVGNTIVSLVGTDWGIRLQGSTPYALVVDNIAMGFGSTTNITGTAATGSDYNITSDATAGSYGTHGLSSKTLANQLTNVSSAAAFDARVKALADVISAGTREQTYTADLDILNQARSITTPTIGAFEYQTGGGGGAVPMCVRQHHANH